MKKLIVVLVIVFLTSCSHYSWVQKNKDEVRDLIGCFDREISISASMTYTSDTTIYAEPKPIDTTILNEYFRCDSNNRVLSKENDSLRQQKGDTLFFDRVKTVTVTKVRSDTVYQIRTKEVPEIVKEKYTPWYIYFIWGVSLALVLFIRFR